MSGYAETKKSEVTRFLTGTRIDPRGSTAFSVVVLVAVLLVGGAGALASFEGLMSAAGWALLVGHLAFTVPVVIDLSLVVFSLAAVLQRSRGQSTKLAWTCVGVLTGISIAINSMHVLIESLDPDDVLGLRVIVGTVLAGLMPATILLVTHTLIDLLVEKPSKSAAEILAEDAAIKAERARETAEREAEIARAEKESAERIAASEGVLVEQQRAADARLERERANSERETAFFEEWEPLRDDPRSTTPGTPQRERFVEMVLEASNRHPNNIAALGRYLDVSDSRIRQIVPATKAPALPANFDTSI